MYVEMRTCVCGACVLVQDAVAKKISNYELAQSYRSTANDLVINSLPGQGLPPKKAKRKPAAKKKSDSTDSDWSKSDSTNSDDSTESEDSNRKPKRKRTRRQTRAKTKQSRAKKKQSPAKKKQSSAKKKQSPAKKKQSPVKKKKKKKTKWTRCYADALTAVVEKNLSNAFNAKLDPATRAKAAMYPFCQRVLRVYLREWKKHGTSELHEQRDKLVAEAVSVVQKHQIRPKDSGPFLGNDERALKTIMCVLEEALVMPKGQAPAGSKVRHVLASTLQVYARFFFMHANLCVLAEMAPTKIRQH